jgi:RNA polymerase subunit RPABC4/transcription elongation factor Spt4
MLLAIWDDGTWQVAATIAVIVLVSYLLVMWIGAIVWAYRDIRARTRDPFTHAIAVMVVLVFNLPGILLYMILRPKETLAEQYDRRLGSEALLQEIQEQEACPTCRRQVRDDFLACPYCRTTLRVPCENCHKPLQTTWIVCPFCAAERTQPQLATRPVAIPAPEPIAAPTPRPERPAPRRASTATYTPPAPKAPPAPADDGV